MAAYTLTDAELEDLRGWYRGRYHPESRNEDRLVAWLRQVVKVRGGLAEGRMTPEGKAIRLKGDG